ncbi:MAG: hypothetical protein A2030_00120 [Chloroflexi bacterium RBG_19FT_COMBO_50_10]|nr:MAG: hypothetical protein A2030_00120 [Chloroflexi bacterium RBG_19FT_COMBO_50_10]
MENQITCPRCKKTISNDSDTGSVGKQAGLVSAFVSCRCGEKITFSAIIDQLRDQESLMQGSKFDFINLPWLEARAGLP